MKKLLSVIILICSSCNLVFAQYIPVGSPADILLRVQQLAGVIADSAGMVSRPYYLDPEKTTGDSNISVLVRSNLHWKLGRQNYFGLFPVVTEQRFVSHHASFHNDGAMIPSKGYQAIYSTGIYGKLGPLHMQLMPEIVYASNRPYGTSTDFGPASFKPYKKITLGQSAIRLQRGPLALSLSTENMWWGPGMHHSLLMTNQAPGFPHLKLHSSRPLQTVIGSFEWTFLIGQLRSDTAQPFDNNYMRSLPPSMISTRYLNAYVFSYQPKFLNGFHIGITRALQTYLSDIDTATTSFVNRYLPVLFKPIQKKNAVGEDYSRVDQLASVFFRLHFPKAKAEVYGEYGFNDYKANIRDYVMNLPHSAAYIIGLRKVYSLNKTSLLDFGFEIRKMSQSPDLLVRNAGNWYYHGQIFEGYTHLNQIMAGPYASDYFTLQIAKQKSMARTAIQLQKIRRNYIIQAPFWTEWQLNFSHAQPLKKWFLDMQVGAGINRNYQFVAQPNKSVFQAYIKTGIRYFF